MGLLEKALRFKSELNRKGDTTLMDTIPGPADTDFDEQPVAPVPDPAGSGSPLPVDDGEDAETVLILEPGDLEEVPADAIEGDEDDHTPAQMALGELRVEVLKAATREDLFEAVLFSIMGQIGVSSSTILSPKEDDGNIWTIEQSRGVEIADRDFCCEHNNSILGDLARRSEILDIEDFKTDKAYAEDYFKFIGIDARLLVPIAFEGEMLAIIALGDKLSQEEYTAEEKQFLVAVSGYAGRALANIMGKLRPEPHAPEPVAPVSAVQPQVPAAPASDEVERIRGLLASEANMEQAAAILQRGIKAMGVESFAIFMRGERNDRFIPVVVDRDDSLELLERNFYLGVGEDFTRSLMLGEGPVVIENFTTASPVVRNFKERMIGRMSMFRLYPHRIAGIIPGFIAVFKALDGTPLPEIDGKLNRLSQFAFEYLRSIRDLDHNRGKYVDTIEHVFSRIESEIERAQKLRIPLTLVLFAIKNYKRYFNLLGYEEVRKLLEGFEMIVRNRLADEDFSVRFDKNRILIVLPGKDKKYAVTFANAVKNEVLVKYSRSDIQLLLTFFISQFPEDGNNIHSLLDAID